MNSKVILAKNIKLDKEYTNVLNYSNDSMVTLCTQNAVYQGNNYSFIRQNRNRIMVQADYGTCLQANYIAFKNTDYSGKWFFGFIDEVVYNSDNATEIQFTVDSFATWFGYWTSKTCFVEREHVSSDNVGEHTQEENLATGDYVVNAHLRESSLRQPRFVIASTVHPQTKEKVSGGEYNGIYSGIAYFTYEIGTLEHYIKNLVDDNKADAIKDLFIAPLSLVTPAGQDGSINESTAPKTIDLGVSPITTLNGYTPKNKKLLTYPYCYILGTNAQGQSATYKQELFTNKNADGDFVFRIYEVLSIGCSIKLVPINYNGDEIATDSGIMLGKFPVLNWTSDNFTNWLSQNGLNIVGGLVGGASHIASGNYVQGGLGIAQTLFGINKASEVPPQFHGNANAGDVMTGMHENTFHVYRMTIKREYAKIIDDFFTRFGYKVNAIKVPNITGRTYWNFVKIGQGEEVGNGSVPTKYMNDINNAFRRGVTVWHNHANIGNFNLDNSIQ